MLQVASRLLGNPSNMDQATLQIEGGLGLGRLGSKLLAMNQCC